MKKLKPVDKILVALLSGILALQMMSALRLSSFVYRSIDGVLICVEYTYWVWEK